MAGFSPADMSSNGLFVFTTLGCVMGLLGLLAVLVTWVTLVSDGWGPVLKALILGNRRGKRRFGRGSRAGRDDDRMGWSEPGPATRGGGGWR